jgi:hypothetical protein
VSTAGQLQKKSAATPPRWALERKITIREFLFAQLSWGFWLPGIALSASDFIQQSSLTFAGTAFNTELDAPLTSNILMFHASFRK